MSLTTEKGGLTTGFATGARDAFSRCGFVIVEEATTREDIHLFADKNGRRFWLQIGIKDAESRTAFDAVLWEILNDGNGDYEKDVDLLIFSSEMRRVDVEKHVVSSLRDVL